MNYPPSEIQLGEFLTAYNTWSGRPGAEFPSDAPPVHAMESALENSILAATFAALHGTGYPHTIADHQQFLLDKIATYERHLKIGEDADANNDFAPWRDMIDTLRCWSDALEDRAAESCTREPAA